MQYGRLDVFWPDGQFQTFPLSESNVSVGRSSGNTIALETTNISRYHFTITRENGEVYITDLESANGTYVDGVRLPTNKPQTIYGGEEIQIGDLRIIFTDMDDSPTRPTIVPEDVTQRIELEAPAFRIDLKGPPQAVPPGAHISGELTITNTGDTPERYAIEVTNLPREWVRVDRPEVEVQPGKTELVVISFKPLRRSDSAPGDYHVNVTVRPMRETMAPLNADLILTVLPYSGFGMALEKRTLRGGDRFRLHLHNQGSDQLPLTVSVRGLNDEMTAQLSAQQVTLGPGQRLLVQGTARPKNQPLFGEPEQYPFDVVVKAQTPAGFITAQRAYVTIKPPLPRWAPLAILGLLGAFAVLVVLGVILLASRTTPTTAPEITRFALSGEQVRAGDPLVVSWAASGASRVTVLVNGTPVFNEDQEIDTESFTIDTSGMAGAVSVELEAANAAGVTTASEQFAIVQPLRIAAFAANPPTLVRNVVGSMTVTWDVPGATVTRLTGLEDFTTSRIEPTYGAQAALENIVGIPETPLTLTLYAEDGAGNAVEQSIVVSVVDPMCEPIEGDLLLAVEPRDDAQTVATLPEGTAVVVDGLDETRQWLRVLLPGGVAGWAPRTFFTCADNFEIDNLRQILVVPTIVPTLSTEEVSETETPEGVVTATPRPTLARTPLPTNIPPIPITPVFPVQTPR